MSKHKNFFYTYKEKNFKLAFGISRFNKEIYLYKLYIYVYINFYKRLIKLRISNLKKWQYLFQIRIENVSNGADII